ncbi:hypothetical protein PCANB_001729 [Pneumocystis canis]|nr:hypothetical protein PCANB_001729 [Pneumocystis canis]
MYIQRRMLSIFCFLKTSNPILKDKSKSKLFKNLSENKIDPDEKKTSYPEFKGDINPKTGEIGGPKTDPLRYGDYSFKGKTVDF